MQRRTKNVISREQALAVLSRAPVFRLASTDDAGLPLLRTLHGVVVGDLLAFHAGPKGEKTLALGRPAVAVADEVVASIPSSFSHEEKACPATTWYRSAMVKGTLQEVGALEVKAAVLQGLMEKLQPEGGYRPITAGDPMYESSVRGLLVAALPLTDLTGKSNVAQHKRPERRRALAEALWRRGERGDDAALEACLSGDPAVAPPAFLAGPHGCRLLAHLGPERLEQAVDLLEGAYWNVGTPRETLRGAHAASQAWVGAVDCDGELIATARAVSDRVKHAWIYDVAVAPSWRGRGIGLSVMGLLLDHPEVRDCAHVHLSTRDAQEFYARLGFDEIARTWREAPDGERWLQRRMHLAGPRAR